MAQPGAVPGSSSHPQGALGFAGICQPLLLREAFLNPRESPPLKFWSKQHGGIISTSFLAIFSAWTRKSQGSAALLPAPLCSPPPEPAALQGEAQPQSQLKNNCTSVTRIMAAWLHYSAFYLMSCSVLSSLQGFHYSQIYFFLAVCVRLPPPPLLQRVCFARKAWRAAWCFGSWEAFWTCWKWLTPSSGLV